MQRLSRVQKFLRFGSLCLTLGATAPLLTACGDSEPQALLRWITAISARCI